MTYAVIMAGGVGSRFWPASTRDNPKQFLSLFSNRSLLQETVSRIEPLIPAERVYIITNSDYTAKVQEQVPDIPADQIIGEPVAKNTAPCVAAAAELIHQNDEDATMVVLPADHYITQPQEFRRVLATAIEKANQGQNLVTIGINPARAETGYGYIKFEEAADSLNSDNDVKKVEKFTEKPDRETAQKFVETGQYLWNSGMFIWKTSSIRREFARQLPEMHALADNIDPEDAGETLHTFYHQCESISIDYGIMEKAGSVYVVPGSFGWNDVGSWKAVYELSEKDKNGNVTLHKLAHFEETEDSLIHSESDKLIAMVGMSNTAVIETDSALLIVNLNEAQTVKQLVNALKEDPEKKSFT